MNAMHKYCAVMNENTSWLLDLRLDDDDVG